MLTESQTAALLLAAAKPNGRISSGHAHRTPDAVLRSLEARGLVCWLASGGPYYDAYKTYKITPEGRAAVGGISQPGAFLVLAFVKMGEAIASTHAAA